ncbi:hypothetical protein EPN42_05765 [bacterium]|nr:MAG: hypothetical protein EPN42_05765 [bacterium]
MKANPYRKRWAAWLPEALEALSKDPPDFRAVMPTMPMPLPVQQVPFAKPVDPRSVSVLTTSGAYDVHIHAPFSASSIIGDATHRILDTWTRSDAIDFAHEHFNQAAARSDLESVLPREAITACGVRLAPHIVSWSGFLLDWPTFIEATIPQIAKQVTSDRPDAALLVPI